MVRRIRDEFHIGTRAPGKGDVVRLTYPAVSTDTRAAKGLTVRDREGDTRTEIPADGWEFVDNRSIRRRPAATLFSPYRIYDLWYEATGSTVMGVGFARDPRFRVVPALRARADRHGTPNPMIAESSGADDTGVRAHAGLRGVAGRPLSAPLP